LELLDALRKAGIQFVLTKQELSAGFMADALWQLTAAPGVLVATLGPGFTNTTTPVAQALLDRSALVVITGEVAAELKGFYTHQIVDQAAVLRPLVKWTATIGPRTALAQVRKGIAIATSPLPGPVHFDLPADAAAARPARAPGEAGGGRVQAAATARDFSQVVSWLGAARRPLLLAGLGVVLDRAEAQLRRCAERWRVPVVTTYKAKGVLPEEHPLALGAAGLSPVVDAIHLERVREADFILCAGFDPVELRSDWIAPWDEKKRTVSLDLVANTHHVYRCALEYAGSIGGALRALAASAPARCPQRWSDGELARYRGAIERAIARAPKRGLGPYQLAAALREVFPRETLATVDTGSHRILLNHVWRCHRPRELLQSNGLGSMGYALPAAIAAKLAYPHRPVLAMTGEAGLDMVIGELALLAHHRLALTLVVFRDDTLSLIKLKQERMRLPATGVATGNPDYAALARAYGGHGVVVENVAQLRQAARAALRAPRFTLIEARIDPAEYREQM
jgi:acetolactate synthase-1/2/3 large subunit